MRVARSQFPDTDRVRVHKRIQYGRSPYATSYEMRDYSTNYLTRIIRDIVHSYDAPGSTKAGKYHISDEDCYYRVFFTFEVWVNGFLNTHHWEIVPLTGIDYQSMSDEELDAQ